MTDEADIYIITLKTDPHYRVVASLGPATPERAIVWFLEHPINPNSNSTHVRTAISVQNAHALLAGAALVAQ